MTLASLKAQDIQSWNALQSLYCTIYGILHRDFWFHCQKPLATLQLVATIAGEAAAGELRGAAILNLLDQKLNVMAGNDMILSITFLCNSKICFATVVPSKTFFQLNAVLLVPKAGHWIHLGRHIPCWYVRKIFSDSYLASNVVMLVHQSQCRAFIVAYHCSMCYDTYSTHIERLPSQQSYTLILRLHMSLPSSFYILNYRWTFCSRPEYTVLSSFQVIESPKHKVLREQCSL